MSTGPMLPTPPMEISEDFPVKATETGPEMDLKQRQMRVMFDNGLDESRFLPFVTDDETLQWPIGALIEFFDVQSEIHSQELHDLSPSTKQYFELLGLKPDQAQSFANGYPEYERCGLLPDQLLVWYFEALVQEEAYEYRREMTEKFGMRLGPISQRYHDQNREALLSTAAGSKVTIQVSGPSQNILDQPVFLAKEIHKYSELPEGPEYLYHSTTLENAVSIAMAGPLVGSLSGRPNDFDGGFYLNTSPKAGMSWATKSSIRTKKETAVLVYKVPEAERASWAELKLRRDSSWAKIVTAFRAQDYSSIDMEALMMAYDVVSGPIVQNVHEVSEQKAGPLPLEDHAQVAILSHRLGVRLKHFLAGILIVGNQD